MTRIQALAAAVLIGGLVTLTGCSTSIETPQSTSTVEAGGTRPRDLSAPCNLGEKWDSATMLKVARYDEPAVDASLLADYGPSIANGSCSDAAIIKWQELRRATGESDEICRITWYDDYLSARTYPIGCAVPVAVVTNASR